MIKTLNLGSLGHPNIPFNVAVTIAKRNSFAAIDPDMGFLRQHAATHGAGATRDWLAATGLQLGSMGLSVAWRDSDSDQAFTDSLVTFRADVALAAELDCSRCTTWVMPRSESRDFYAHFDLVVPRLRQIARLLGERGMRLGLEFVGPDTMRTDRAFDFVHTLDGMRTLAAAIGSEFHNTGLLLDIFHWWVAHGTVTELKCLTARDIVYVHLNDAIAGRDRDQQIDQERDMVGMTGVLPVVHFMSALRAVGYHGLIAVEPFNAQIRAMTPEAAAALASTQLDKVLTV